MSTSLPGDSVALLGKAHHARFLASRQAPILIEKGAAVVDQHGFGRQADAYLACYRQLV